MHISQFKKKKNHTKGTKVVQLKVPPQQQGMAQFSALLSECMSKTTAKIYCAPRLQWILSTKWEYTQDEMLVHHRGPCAHTFPSRGLLV